MKYLNKLTFVIFLLPFFLPSISIAQSNYKPGVVVNLKGDTLHGFIDYRAWDSNPTVISFKSTVDESKTQQLTINDISFFSVANLESYQRTTCSISLDETNISRISAYKDTSSKMATVFFKILQKGKNVALYSYSDNLKTRFYRRKA